MSLIFSITVARMPIAVVSPAQNGTPQSAGRRQDSSIWNPCVPRMCTSM